MMVAMVLQDQKPQWERLYSDRVIGARVLVYGEVDSTMDVARALTNTGVVHGTAVRADVQRRGRGRFDRRWESAPGDSLLMSVVLRMPPLEVGAPLTVIGSLAVLQAVEEISGATAGIKWPNDVQMDGRKIAGVLVESQVSTDGTGAAILGVGLNVNLRPEAFVGIEETATSLAVLGRGAIALDRVEDVLLRKLDTAVAALDGGGAGVVAEWRSHLTTLGQRIAVHTRDGVVKGEAVDVDAQGALLLRVAGGEVRRILEGDVSLRG